MTLEEARAIAREVVEKKSRSYVQDAHALATFVLSFDAGSNEAKLVPERTIPCVPGCEFLVNAEDVTCPQGHVQRRDSRFDASLVERGYAEWDALLRIAKAASDVFRTVPIHPHNRSGTGCGYCQVLNELQAALRAWGDLPEVPRGGEVMRAARESLDLVARASGMAGSSSSEEHHEGAGAGMPPRSPGSTDERRSNDAKPEPNGPSGFCRACGTDVVGWETHDCNGTPRRGADTRLPHQVVADEDRRYKVSPPENGYTLEESITGVRKVAIYVGGRLRHSCEHDVAPEVPTDPPKPKRIPYRCSRCGVAEMSGELPPITSDRLQIYPLPSGWELVSCPDLQEDDHLHCAVCVERKPAAVPA